MTKKNESNVKNPPASIVEGVDFYWEGHYMVFTQTYLLKRGECCGSGCRHCPYRKSKKSNIAS